MSRGAWRQLATVEVKAFICLLTLSLLHRILYMPWLIPASYKDWPSVLAFFYVGALSDVWISWLLTLPVLAVLSIRCLKASANILITVWLVTWSALFAGHQAYCEFFRQQIIPFHLAYLTDTSFVGANGLSLFTVRPAALVAIGLLLTLWAMVSSGQTKSSKHSRVWFLIGGLVVATSCHAVNIRIRVQWFVPEALQTHLVENLYTGLKTKRVMTELTPSEIHLLQDIPANRSNTKTRELLTLSHAVPSMISSGFARILQERQAHSSRVFVVTILAESFRPADSGWMRTEIDPPSITKSFDQLAIEGVLFENAYSSGPVTRGGQEAVWCGVPTATDTSLMRSFQNIEISCIPDRTLTERYKTAWIHGGDPRFDSQDSFWQKHNVTNLITRELFEKSAPTTGWGISDKSVFKRSLSEMIALKSSKTDQSPHIFVPLILSVTNHIPWDLPEDASQSVTTLKAQHPQERTVMYFDEALGEFVDQLKQANLWEDTLLIVVGDHGNLEPPRNQSYFSSSELLYEQLYSHINLLISGGITTQARTEGKIPGRIADFVSQTQIAPFIASVLGVDVQGFFDVELFSKPIWPVASDLNQFLYLPEQKIRIPKESLYDGTFSSSSREERLAAARYRAFVNLLYGVGPQ
jgi:hypothetical protein